MFHARPVIVNTSFIRSKCGFTVTELLVVIAIIGILASMAYPSLKDIIRSSQLKSTASDMTLALKFARGAAVKSNDRVTVCRSIDGATCNTHLGFWEEGWIIFQDSLTSGTLGVVDAGETIIRRYPAVVPGATLRSGSNISNYISFRDNGVARGHNNVFGNGTFRVCNHSGKESAIAIIINSTGRIRTARGTSVCP